MSLGTSCHVRRVRKLYKDILRNIMAWQHYDRCSVRILSVQVRHEFDKNRCIKDEVEMNELVKNGENWHYEREHFSPIYFATSPKGVAYNREVVPPDWVLDYWHPLEKAMYPKYFAKREERKKEYIDWYNRTYNVSEDSCKWSS